MVSGENKYKYTSSHIQNFTTFFQLCGLDQLNVSVTRVPSRAARYCMIFESQRLQFKHELRVLKRGCAQVVKTERVVR